MESSYSRFMESAETEADAGGWEVVSHLGFSDLSES